MISKSKRDKGQDGIFTGNCPGYLCKLTGQAGHNPLGCVPYVPP